MSRLRTQTRHIGDGELRAQMLFICALPSEITDEVVHALIKESLETLHTAEAEYPFTDFVVYVESSHEGAPTYTSYQEGYFSIPGRLVPLTIENIKPVIAEKTLHANPEWRKAGNVSTHPPAFLRKDILIIVIGSREYIGWTIDLTLERRGLLRSVTFELLLSLLSIEPINDRLESSAANCLLLILQTKEFYVGNFDELARRHGQRTRMEDADILKRLGIESSDESDEESTSENKKSRK